MFDQQDAAIQLARHLHELRPSFRGSFGVVPPTTVTVVARQAHPAACFSQHDSAADALPGGPLRAAVWVERTGNSSSSVCAHLVVVNTAKTAATSFVATLSGPLVGHSGLTARRLFTSGPTLDIAANGTVTEDFVGPASLHRLGRGNGGGAGGTTCVE